MRTPETKTTKRRREIVAQLAELSRNGWENARPCDYEPLEQELADLDAYIDQWRH